MDSLLREPPAHHIFDKNFFHHFIVNTKSASGAVLRFNAADDLLVFFRVPNAKYFFRIGVVPAKDEILSSPHIKTGVYISRKTYLRGKFDVCATCRDKLLNKYGEEALTECNDLSELLMFNKDEDLHARIAAEKDAELLIDLD